MSTRGKSIASILIAFDCQLIFSGRFRLTELTIASEALQDNPVFFVQCFVYPILDFCCVIFALHRCVSFGSLHIKIQTGSFYFRAILEIFDNIVALNVTVTEIQNEFDRELENKTNFLIYQIV